MDKAAVIAISIVIAIHTIITCVFVSHEVDRAERWLDISIKNTDRDVNEKFRDIGYDLKSIRGALKELRDSLKELRDSLTPEDNEDTMVSIKDVIATLEKMREV